MVISPNVNALEEWELADRLKNLEDRDVWREFVALYSRIVHGAAIRRGCNYADAEDVAQETVTSVARQIGTFRTEPAVGSFHAWVMRIAHCRIVDCFRTSGKWERQSVALYDDRDDRHHLERKAHEAIDIWEHLWTQEAQRKILDTAMERVRAYVSRKPYEAFKLALWDDVSIPEISRRLGLRPAEIYLAKHRVKALLRKELRRLEKAET